MFHARPAAEQVVYLTNLSKGMTVWRYISIYVSQPIFLVEVDDPHLTSILVGGVSELIALTKRGFYVNRLGVLLPKVRFADWSFFNVKEIKIDPSGFYAFLTDEGFVDDT